MRIHWYIFLILLVMTQIAISDVTNSNDPNEFFCAKYETVFEKQNDPNVLLETLRNAFVEVLQSENIDLEEKIKILDKIISPAFDFPLMSKLTLGRENWLRLTLSQRERFTCLFIERLKSSYLKKVELFNNEEMLIKPAVQKKNSIHVPIELIYPDKKIIVLYKFHKTGNCLKIYDVEIQGVSIVLTYRSQFEDILSHGSVEELLLELEKLAAS